MSVLAYTKARLDAFIRELDSVRCSEFPYAHSADALDRLRDQFTELAASLDQVDEAASAEVVNALCSVVILNLHQYLPFLGFLLRSTNVRNAFEVYGPLLRLARDIVGPQVRLVLSSEWQFAPHTYSGVPILPGFVLIGMPAPHSSDPLVLPLAGHELGHAVWKYNQLDLTIKSRVNDGLLHAITNNGSAFDRHYGHLGISAATVTTSVLSYYALESAADLAINQAEEMFCDFIGLRLFGESYPRALAYLLSPNTAIERSPKYPKPTRRAAVVLSAANQWRLNVQPDYSSVFDDLPEAYATEEEAFRIVLADAAAQYAVTDLMNAATVAIPSLTVDPARVERCLECLRLNVPATGAGHIANVTVAGWTLFMDATYAPQLKRDERHRIIRELMLKTIEVLEIEELVGG